MLLAFLTIIGSEINATAIQTSLPNLIQMVLSVTFHYRISPKWRRQTPPGCGMHPGGVCLNMFMELSFSSTAGVTGNFK